MGLAAIAHEIRQPLTGISLTASAGVRALEQATPDVRKAKAFFGEIQSGAAQAHDVFVAILKLFKGELERGTVDVNSLTIEATRSMRNALNDNNVVLRTQLAAQLPVIEGHAGQIREVILNLIQNSIDAMASTTINPRVISIETSRLDSGAVSISLRDNGPGIEPQVMATIFDPFVTTKASGTGLGLGICKMIVEHHGGQLSACNENGGARFDVILPAVSGWPAHAAQA
jgi:signal transduction histidine kinase